MFGVTANPGASAIIRLLCWQLLPTFATRQCLAIFHSFLRYIGREPPAPGTPQYAIHWRWTHAAVITAYLFYSFEDASSLLPPNYYELLGVSPNANDDELKAAFRRFARRNHPDHVGRDGEELFIAVRDAYEALKDPLKRYAYDRFGKDALNWKLATRTDYMWTGQQQAAMFYGGSLIFLLVVDFFQRSPSSFWRYLLLASAQAFELRLTTRSRGFYPLSFFFPGRVTYQHVLLLHQVYISMSLAITHILPDIFPPGAADNASVTNALLNRTAVFSQNISDATTRLLQETMLAFKSDQNSTEKVLADQKTVDDLADSLVDLIIDSSLRSHPGIRAIYESAIRESSSNRQPHTNGSIAQPQVLDKVQTPPPSPPRSPAPIPKDDSVTV